MLQTTWRWILGMLYVVAVAVIWIVASFVVQSVVDGGASPFLITYICNTLFVVYLPLVEIGRASEIYIRRIKAKGSDASTLPLDGSTGAAMDSETQILLQSKNIALEVKTVEGLQSVPDNRGDTGTVCEVKPLNDTEPEETTSPKSWTRGKTARVSLIICPFWFCAQYTFNLSLKYTTVTSNTILSSTSSLFTFLMSLKFLHEKFTWVKLWSILLCMAGTVIVSLSDSESSSSVPTKHVFGDLLCLSSAIFYAAYTTLIRIKLPDEAQGEEKASTALFFGFLGLFNGIILLPVALILHFSGVEPFHKLSLMQYGLIIGKGMLDNVLSDYLWAKAVLLTSTTAATAGLTIQVPIAAVVDSIRGVHISVLEYVGGLFVLLGFFGINEAATNLCSSEMRNDEDIVESREIDPMQP